MQLSKVSLSVQLMIIACCAISHRVWGTMTVCCFVSDLRSALLGCPENQAREICWGVENLGQVANIIP